ncbi:MAG: hypothetical protein IPO83_17420 [Chitinophagaceae bacterium]|nr:hypothetical protein [Chitinophagaceae bacterium]
MKRRIIKILSVTAIVLLALVATGMLVGVVFGDKIKQLAVKELNKRLATEVAVNGSIDFSVLTNFPAASITFNQVSLKETLPEKTNLLTCEKITLLFNILDIFEGNYTMKKILVQEGELYLKVTESGIANYNIFKPSADSSGKGFSMKIEEAILSNILIQYDNLRSNQHLLFDTRESSLSGDFSSGNFLLKIQSDFTSKKISIDGIDYFSNREVKINGTLDVDLSINNYNIKESSIAIENNSFTVSGTIQSLENGNKLDLKLGGTELRIEQLAALLPDEYAVYLAHFKSEGTIRFDGSIKGLVNADTQPHVSISFDVKNGTLSHDEMNEPFKSLNLQGAFSNGALNSLVSSSFNLSKFSTSFDGNVVSGNILLQNFKEPFLDMKLDGAITLQKIKPLFPSDYIKELEGVVTFRQFYFKGPVSQLTKTATPQKIEAGGYFNLSDVKIGTDLTTYENLNGTFDINNNQVVINQLSFNANESDLSITGNINNFIPYFLSSLTDSTKSNHKIGLNIQLSSRSLAWTDLVGVSGSPSKEGNHSKGNYYSIPSLFYVFTGSISGAIDKFSYDKFNAAEIHGKILFLGNAIYFNDFGLKAEKGKVVANGKLDISNMKRNKLEMTATLDRLDITQLFYEFNNFGQVSLTDKNLKGLITSELALQATWDERIFNRSKLYAIADVTIDNGELNNFDPMMALAKFVKISELKNIRFSKLQNQVEIKNQKIYIPQMQIFTNALNLQLSGTHSFENIIDYKIQLNLLKLLTSKFEKSAGNLPETDKTTEGFLNLYLTMTGPADNPLIKYDKKAVKEKISADLKKEKNELKDVLKKEFDQQEQDQQKIKDWKAPDQIQYMDFEEDSLPTDEQENKPTITKENQKKELDNFKKLFKPKDTVPK